MPAPSPTSPSNKHSDKNKAVLLGIAAFILLGIVGYETFGEKELYQYTPPSPPNFTIPNIPNADVEIEGLRIKMGQMSEKLNEMKRLLFVRGQAPDTTFIRELNAELQNKNETIDHLKDMIASHESAMADKQSKMATLEHSLSALADLIEIQRTSKENYHTALLDSMDRAKNQVAEEHQASIQLLEQHLQGHVEEIHALNDQILLQKQQIHTLTDSFESELHQKKQEIAEFNQALQAASHQYAGLIDESLIEKTLHNMQTLEAIESQEQELAIYKTLTEELEKKVALLTEELQSAQFEYLSEKLALTDSLQEKDYLLHQALTELDETKHYHIAERKVLLDQSKEKEENLIAEHNYLLETQNGRLDATKQAHESTVQGLQVDCETLKKELAEARQDLEPLKLNLLNALQDLDTSSKLNIHMDTLLTQTAKELDELKQAHLNEMERGIGLEYAKQQESETYQCQMQQMDAEKQSRESALEHLQKECDDLKKDLAESKLLQDTLREELHTTLNHFEEVWGASNHKDSLLSDSIAKLNETKQAHLEVQEKHSLLAQENEELQMLIQRLESAKQAGETLVESLKQDLADALQGKDHHLASLQEKEELESLINRLEESKQAQEALVDSLQKELAISKHDLANAFENIESASSFHIDEHGKHLATLQEKEELENLIHQLESAKHAEETKVEDLQKELALNKQNLALVLQNHDAEKENLEHLIRSLETAKQAEETLVETLKQDLASALNSQENHLAFAQEKKELENLIKRLEESKQAQESAVESLQKELAISKQDLAYAVENIESASSFHINEHGKHLSALQEKEELENLIQQLYAAKKVEEEEEKALLEELADSKQKLAAFLQQHDAEKEDLEHLVKSIDAAKQAEEAIVEALHKELAEIKENLALALQHHDTEKEELDLLVQRLDAAKRAEEAMVVALQKELAENKIHQDSLKQDLAAAFQHHGTEKEDLENLIQRLDTAKLSEESMVKSLQKELEDNKAQQDTLKQELAAALEHLEAASTFRVDEHDKHLAVSQEKENLEHLIQHLDAAKQAEEALAEALRKELAEGKQEQQNLKAELASALEKLESASNLAEHKDALLFQAAHELNQTKQAHLEEQARHSALNGEKEELMSQIEQIQANLQKTEQALEASSHTLTSLQGELKDKASELDSHKQEKDNLLENLKTLNMSLEKEKEQAKEIAHKLATLQKDSEKVVAIEDIDNPDQEEPYFDDPTSEEDEE